MSRPSKQCWSRLLFRDRAAGSLITESYLALRLAYRFATVPPAKYCGRNISVAIPTYNNARLMHVSLLNILRDPRVSEIVVLDDGSPPREVRALKARLKAFSGKVKLFHRDSNWGAFANKIQAVELCANDWVLLLDADNTLLPEYLNALFSLGIWDANTIYCPAFARPHYDFRAELGGRVLSFDDAANMAAANKLNRPFFNDGNYFLHKDSYVARLKPGIHAQVSAADVAFANYIWLSEGGFLAVLRTSAYLHRIHPGSSWLNNAGTAMAVLDSILHWLALGIKWPPPDSDIRLKCVLRERCSPNRLI